MINVSQEQLNDFLKEGEEELKETKSIFTTSSFTAQGNQIESQFFKSKSINHIANKEFFILPALAGPVAEGRVAVVLAQMHTPFLLSFLLRFSLELLHFYQLFAVCFFAAFVLLCK